MRELIYQALVSDQSLIDRGFDSGHIFPNYGFSQIPRDKMSLVIRYSDQDISASHIGRGAESVEVWVHQPKEIGNDMVVLRDTLLDVKEVIMSLELQSGFGYRITSVKFEGFGSDLSDPGYNTLTKKMAFRILSHPVG